MRKSTALQMISLIFLAVGVLPAAGSLHWRLSGEAGLYGAADNTSSAALNFVGRLSGILNWNQSVDRNQYGISFQVKPEYYDDISAQRAVKFISRGNFNNRRQRVSLGASYDARKYFYHSRLRNLTLDIFELQGNLSWFINRRNILVIYPSYYYRDLTNASSQKLDAFMTEIDWRRSLSPGLQGGTGIHLEIFNLQGVPYESGDQMLREDRGWRMGPKFFLDYRKKYHMTLSYFLFWSRSTTSDFSAMEHFFRFFWGRVFSRQWTAFILIDYYWNHTSSPSGPVESVLYLPIDLENRIDLKLERMSGKRLVYYLKFGYFKNTLQSGDLSLDGWQGLLGLELSR